MSTTTIRTNRNAHTVPDLLTIKTSVDALLHTLAEADLNDPRWESAGPLVSAAALRLREALGTEIRGKCVSVPPIVRAADFAQAARPLLADAALVVPAAAQQFVQLAGEAALALR
jgi:hypothetical protein